MTPGRVYILPTRTWTILLAVLAAMWYAAISQANSAAYLLMFFLGSIVLVSAVHAHFALTELGLRVHKLDPVFVGDLVAVKVEVLNYSRRDKTALAVAPNGHVFKTATHGAAPTLAAGGSTQAQFMVPSGKRGRLVLKRVALTTVYPMGFFRSWRYETTDATCLVYPSPDGQLPLPDGAPVTADVVAGAGGSGDDYTGVRAYQEGESQRHVDWRAVARGQPLLVKQFSGSGSRRLVLTWDETAPAGELEARLAQLSRWVVDADRAGFGYGLEIPGFHAEPARGSAHYHRCLGALALFGHPGEVGA